MKRWIVLVLLMALTLSACDTGVKPAVPEKETSTTGETQDTTNETVEDVYEDETINDVDHEDENSSDESSSGEDIGKGSIDEDDSVVDNQAVNESAEEEVLESDTNLPVIAPIEPISDKLVVSSNAVAADEVKAVWISYLELQQIFALGSESTYRSAVESMMIDIKSLGGMNTVMYQVRPFADALYDSAIFPPSSYIITGGQEGDRMTYDPFQIAIESAKKHGLRIEAWINPYRVRSASSKTPLSNNNIAKLWYEDGSRRVLKTPDGTIIYNPAIEEVRDHILSGVKEIIDYYEVDGIHFDDYFYPSTDMSYDEVEYLAFSYDDDTLTQADFRRANVNKLITNVYQLVHSYNRDLVFGISPPQGVIDTNYNQLYVDIPLWLSASGYIDYICPQVYYGFEHERSAYDSTLDEWNHLISNNVDLVAGIAVYKIGSEDKWAGTGKSEWIESERILQRMIELQKRIVIMAVMRCIGMIISLSQQKN